MSHWCAILFTEHVFECHCLLYRYGQISQYFVILGDSNNNNNDNDTDNNDNDNGDDDDDNDDDDIDNKTNNSNENDCYKNNDTNNDNNENNCDKRLQTPCQSLYKDRCIWNNIAWHNWYNRNDAMLILYEMLHTCSIMHIQRRWKFENTISADASGCFITNVTFPAVAKIGIRGKLCQKLS